MTAIPKSYTGRNYWKMRLDNLVLYRWKYFATVYA
jgi:hypothetical protein